jgi:hypothetical protein
VDAKETLLRIMNRRRAVSRGEPRIAAVLGQASMCLLEQGVLSWTSLDSRCISVLDTQKHESPVEIHISEIVGDSMTDFDGNPFTLLHYSDGIISVLYEEESDGLQWLLVASVPLDKQSFAQPLRSIPLADSRKLFVRNTRDFLYYGTHSYRGSHGHREWVIQGISLRNEKPFPGRSQSIRADCASYESVNVYLTDFVGDQIGKTAIFRIHNGYFYAVTNTDDFDAVEVDWTSFYHCFKFPVHDPHKDNIRLNHALYRRQHLEGPMHDGWLKLDLQVDERTDELLIVETRKEWLLGTRQATRTTYITKLAIEDSSTIEVAEASSHRGTVRPTDPFAIYATSASKFRPRQDREHWQVHNEELNLQMDTSKEKAPKAPLLAHTKYQTYDVASKTFIDVVEDFSCCSTKINSDRGHGCLRLRTCSRQYRANRDRSTWGYAPLPSSGGPGPYSYSPVSHWPPSAEISKYAQNAHILMAPKVQEQESLENSGNISGLIVEAMSDERTIVLLIRASANDVNGKLVCLGFDSQAAFKHLGELGNPPQRPRKQFRDKSPERKDSLMEDDDMQVDHKEQATQPIMIPSQHEPDDNDTAMEIDPPPADRELQTIRMWNPDTRSYVLISTDVDDPALLQSLSRSWMDIWDMNIRHEVEWTVSDDMSEFIDLKELTYDDASSITEQGKV